MIELPQVVRNKAIAVGAQDWIVGLDGVVADLAARWHIEVGRAYEDATEAFVAAARRDDGEECVLKVHIARDGGHALAEITTLALAGGVGCVRMMEHDAAHGALLVERLGPSLRQLGLPLERRHEILCDAARRVWRPAPDCALPTGRERAESLMTSVLTLWDQLDRPCSERAVDFALRCGERRAAAHDDERAVLIHGDVHQWNALQAVSGFKLVDPDGGLAEAECDLGVLMREDPLELLAGDPRERARWLAARCGLDEAAIWEWGALERVATGLLCVRDELEPFGRQMLAAAERCAD